MDRVMRIFMLEDNLNLNAVVENIIEAARPLNLVDNNLNVRRQIPRNLNYVEKIVPLYDNDMFKEHFRMRKATFEELCTVIANQRNGLANGQIPLEKKVLFTIFFISNKEPFLYAGDRFGIAKSTAHYIFNEILDVILQLMPQFITWPNDHNTSISIFHERSNGFPGVVGAIDGCHVQIKQPRNNAIDYYNRKEFHSIILQGVCDAHCRFIDVFIGLPGRMHDSRVFKNSPLYRLLNRNENPLLPEQLHIIGDSAYPVLPFLMTPFRDNGHLTERQINYNTKLCAIRSVIERAFGRLKGKFRKLKYIDVDNADSARNIVAAACVIHNFILRHENEEECYGANNADEIYENYQEERENNIAIMKRQQIMNLL